MCPFHSSGRLRRLSEFTQEGEGHAGMRLLPWSLCRNLWSLLFFRTAKGASSWDPPSTFVPESLPCHQPSFIHFHSKQRPGCWHTRVLCHSGSLLHVYARTHARMQGTPVGHRPTASNLSSDLTPRRLPGTSERARLLQQAGTVSTLDPALPRTACVPGLRTGPNLGLAAPQHQEEGSKGSKEGVREQRGLAPLISSCTKC